MLLWVYSITDHKRVAHDVQSSASRMFFPYFDISVIDYKTDEQQYGVYSLCVSVLGKKLGFSGVSGQLQKYLKNPKAERVRGISHQA